MKTRPLKPWAGESSVANKLLLRPEPRNPEELSAKGEKFRFPQAAFRNPNQVVLTLNVDIWTFTMTMTRALGGIWGGGGTDLLYLI